MRKFINPPYRKKGSYKRMGISKRLVMLTVFRDQIKKDRGEFNIIRDDIADGADVPDYIVKALAKFDTHCQESLEEAYVQLYDAGFMDFKWNMTELVLGMWNGTTGSYDYHDLTK